MRSTNSTLVRPSKASDVRFRGFRCEAPCLDASGVDLLHGLKQLPTQPVQEGGASACPRAGAPAGGAVGDVSGAVGGYVPPMGGLSGLFW